MFVKPFLTAVHAEIFTSIKYVKMPSKFIKNNQSKKYHR